MQGELAAAPNAAPTWLRDALGVVPASSRARRAARAITLGLAGVEVGRKAWAWSRKRISYSVSVPASDEVYPALQEWLLGQVAPRDRRSLVARTLRGGRSASSNDAVLVSDYPGSARDSTPPAELVAGLDGHGTTHYVKIDGHRISVQVVREALGEGFSLSVNNLGGEWSKAYTKVEFTAYGIAARDAVLAFLARLVDEKLATDRIPPRIWIGRRWGEWSRVGELRPRPLDTVILPEAQKRKILADVKQFLDAEARYSRVGVPWHHGLLFHGRPGCGKTSMATAIADHFDLDVYLLPLSDVEEDTMLVQLLGAISSRSVLVLEDIDVVHAATERDDDRKGVTLSGLLNALDGIASAHGLITIMTTNHLDSLDEALVRPGRVDLSEEFGPLDDEQARAMAALVVGGPVWPTPPPDWPAFPTLGDADLTHAELLDAAKPHLDGPLYAYVAMIDRILDRRAHSPISGNVERDLANRRSSDVWSNGERPEVDDGVSPAR